MDEVFAQQEELAGKISRMFLNFKKKGEAAMTAEAAQTRLELLSSYWDRYQENHNNILKQKIKQKDIKNHEYFVNDQFSSCEEAFLENKTLFRRFSTAKNIDNAKHQNRGSSDVSSHLPSILIPKFGGDLTEWRNFKDIFCALVINRPQLSKVEKLHYLKTSLCGESFQLLQNIEINEINFDRAWNILNERYENKRILIHAHLDKIFSIRTSSKESAAELKRVYNTAIQHIEALTSLDCPTHQWDLMFVHIVRRALDPQTRKDWETSCEREDITFDDMKVFIRRRIQALESMEVNVFKSYTKTVSTPKHSLLSQTENKSKCECCGQEHYLAYCHQFKSIPIEQRLNLIKRKNLCINCLGLHGVKDCYSKKRCLDCGNKHHTLIHRPLENMQAESSIQARRSDDKKAVTVNLSYHDPTAATKNHFEGVSLLSTALVITNDYSGQEHLVRALIDTGSEVSLISESLTQRLKLKRTSGFLSVSGIGSSSIRARGKVRVEFFSRFHPETIFSADAYILPRITQYRPMVSPEVSKWIQQEMFNMADDYLSSNQPIEMLLGADIYPQLIRAGLRKSPSHLLVAQDTNLGWILLGSLESTATKNSSAILACSIDDQLQEDLRKFWEQEEINVNSPVSTNDLECEEHFKQNYKRLPDGSYLVRLPFKANPLLLGASRQYAETMLHRLENRFTNNLLFKSMYTAFLKEYEDLHHMQQINSSHIPRYYLPHHGVFKASSTSTKLRVVFNASAKTSTGYSLNDLLHSGPLLLPRLDDVLIRWRKHKVCFSADIEKMYRCIRLHDDDQLFQAILWRDPSTQELKSYQLKTVTYGMSCSPFLAIRTLHQLANDEKSRFPIGSAVLKEDAYVDDILSGANSLEEAKVMQRELLDLLQSAKFNLRKWTSNRRELLDHLSLDQIEKSSDIKWDSLEFSVLGLRWQSDIDSFHITIHNHEMERPITKRNVLKRIAKLFDPLGLIAPIIVRAKLFLQSIWISGVGWDEPLPSDVSDQWTQFCDELMSIKDFIIPRWIGFTDFSQMEIHGFSDASERAYGAVVYLRTQHNGIWESRLIAAKSKLAPLKQISLPRLELSAAVLLTHLTNKIISALKISKASVYLWSDSTITLSWIKEHPSKWKTFVANRVSIIQTTLPNTRWRHVASNQNPADLISRGMQVSKLKSNFLWWYGPDWLKLTIDDWPKVVHIPDCSSERKRTTFSLMTRVSQEEPEILLRFSELTRLLRIVTWIFRFTKPRKFQERSTILSTEEISDTKHRLISHLQNIFYAKEVSNLEKEKSVDKRSSISKLDPWLDSNRVLRVGGRLKHSSFSSAQKHPIILPNRLHFTELLIKDAHSRTLHGGVQLTLSYLRRHYWIPQARRAVKSLIHKCVTCIRFRGSTTYQKMGNLPKERVTPSRPFFHTGVDYAGPTLLKTHKGRGAKCVKGYIAVFICFSTKAIHLEAVTDYTTGAFMAAYRRFVSRRGICATLFSDHGTNFVGAHRELQQLCSKEGTQWKFIPPGAPHFGGLWEAGVKSMKYHLRRVMGDTRYTYEELSTLLCQIEACLNSRPLEPLSDDPSDLEALTPGHFLIGEPINAIPDPFLADVPTSRLSKFQFFQHQRNQFWTRWTQEYLVQLQTRQKWTQSKPNIKVGDLVLVKGEHLPPSRWPLGRITRLHSGSDGLVRVATIQTASSVLTRPATKLVLLVPHTQENQLEQYYLSSRKAGRDVRDRPESASAQAEPAQTNAK